MFRRLRDGFQKSFKGKREVRQEEIRRSPSHMAPQANVLGRPTHEALGSIEESPPVPVEEVIVDIDADCNSDYDKGDDDKSEALVSQYSTTAGAASSVDGSLEGDLMPKALHFSDPTDLIDDDQLERDYEMKVRQRLLEMMKKAGVLDDDAPRHPARPPEHSQLLAEIQDDLGVGDVDDCPKRSCSSACAPDVIGNGPKMIQTSSGTADPGVPAAAIGLPLDEPKRVQTPACGGEAPFSTVFGAPAFDSSLAQNVEDANIPTVSRSPKAKARVSAKMKV